jgi:hypothetical protein
MKFENSTFASAGEARLLAAEGEREIARAIVAFFARMFTGKKSAPSKPARDALNNLILH